MPKTNSAEGGQKPVHTVRHRSVKATIWRNQSDKGPLYNVVITRSYRDKETNEWHDTQSLRYDDLMNVVALLQEAHRYISACIAKEKAPPAKPVRGATRPAARQSSKGQQPLVPDQEVPY